MINEIQEDFIVGDSAYSYHTFYFPFIWNCKDDIELKQYEERVKSYNGNKWDDVSVSGFDDIKKNKELDLTKEQLYQSIQYYTKAGREAVLGWGKDFVRIYSLNQEAIHDKTEYHIKKGDYEYNLRLNGVKLRLYNTGIGILIFETENHKNKTLDDVKRINEWGRRIYMPYISDFGCADFADELGVKEICNNTATIKMPLSEEECIPEFIGALLPPDIKPAIDDRMFVSCLVNDKAAFTDFMKYKTDDVVSESLYEFVFIDRPENCSCPTVEMRNELLKNSIYERWVENTASGKPAGTLYGVTHHSFTAITCPADEHIVERPFLVLYCNMIATVLAQRAAVLKFDSDISDASENFEKRNIALRRRKRKNLLRLQERYIAFLNQHLNLEITCQEQGIELYQMMQKHLYIHEEKENLEKEIELLSNAANTAQDYYINRIAIIISIIIVFAQPVADSIFNNGVNSILDSWKTLALFGITVLTAIYIWHKS